jgi:hypothetical protein
MPPSEIAVVNRGGRKFRAYFTGFYNIETQSYQYRVILPEVEVSLVTIDFSRNVLRQHLRTGKPILIVPP